MVLVPEEPEDMWHAYNLISEDDYVRSTTIRKVQNETATGSSSSSRVRTTLTICVETMDFDTQACVLRLKGRNVEENQYVKVKNIKQTNASFFSYICQSLCCHLDGCLSHIGLRTEPKVSADET